MKIFKKNKTEVFKKHELFKQVQGSFKEFIKENTEYKDDEDLLKIEFEEDISSTGVSKQVEISYRLKK